MIIGVISDTHGLLRPEALSALEGAERIIHAGDIGPERILRALEAIAPVIAVRGNTDYDAWSRALPLTAMVELGGAHLYVLHDATRLDLDPAAAGVAVVISGHTHVPVVERRGGVMYLNPGSAGPRRFTLPVTVARLVVADGRADASITELVV